MRTSAFELGSTTDAEPSISRQRRWNIHIEGLGIVSIEDAHGMPPGI
ncbi:MAG: hypothetical protein M5U19_00575 [Microthrixaceae bacterium]|nr:hypothetical protein [Microthrixaceae bacterium]